MNKSMQVLRLAFLLGSFFNNLGWVENSVVAKRSQTEWGVEHLSNSVRNRRMMLGLGSEASTSSIWGYLYPESENKKALVKRHEDKRTRTLPLSKLHPAIVLEDGDLSEKDSSPATSPTSLDPNSKRSVAGSPPHGTIARVTSKIVLVKRKVSEFAGFSRPGISPQTSNYDGVKSKIVLSNNGKRSKQRGNLARANSKIVLSNGKRSAVGSRGISTNSAGKIVLSKDKRGISKGSTGGNGKIVLFNGKRSQVSSFSSQSAGTSESQTSAIQSDIVLGNPGRRSSRTTSALKTKRTNIATPISIISINVPKRKRYELDLMPENFAKPLPIYQEFEQ